MNRVFLQLGSNLGEREQLLSSAIDLISDKLGKVVVKSKVYESTPWGVDGQQNYLNQIVEVKSRLSAEETLTVAHDIENKLGRLRLEKWGERLIDIDIIFYNDEIIETPYLCVPHKHMHQRNFVLEPLNEIASDLIHPRYKKSVEELLRDSKDIHKVEEYEI